jgi:hypothetical protein
MLAGTVAMISAAARMNKTPIIKTSVNALARREQTSSSRKHSNGHCPGIVNHVQVLHTDTYCFGFGQVTYHRNHHQQNESCGRASQATQAAVTCIITDYKHFKS